MNSQTKCVGKIKQVLQLQFTKCCSLATLKKKMTRKMDYPVGWGEGSHVKSPLW